MSDASLASPPAGEARPPERPRGEDPSSAPPDARRSTIKAVEGVVRDLHHRSDQVRWRAQANAAEQVWTLRVERHGDDGIELSQKRPCGVAKVATRLLGYFGAVLNNVVGDDQCASRAPRRRR